jgi:hypothetical protein
LPKTIYDEQRTVSALQRTVQMEQGKFDKYRLFTGIYHSVIYRYRFVGSIFFGLNFREINYDRKPKTSK